MFTDEEIVELVIKWLIPIDMYAHKALSDPEFLPGLKDETDIMFTEMLERNVLEKQHERKEQYTTSTTYQLFELYSLFLYREEEHIIWETDGDPESEKRAKPVIDHLQNARYIIDSLINLYL